VTAADELNRIVSLVADMSRRSDGAATLAELAEAHDTTVQQVQTDIRTLTVLGDDPEADWLLSLQVTQEGDRVELWCGGPFRRPIRFTPDELLAIQLGLATEPDAVSDGLSDELAALLEAEPSKDDPPPYCLGAMDGDSGVIGLVQRAIHDYRKLEMVYAGEGDHEGTARVIQPHDLVSWEGRSYVIAWCEHREGWRNFRADRVIEACLATDTFEEREDFVPMDDPASVFSAPDDGVDEVRVRFSPLIARWLLERYPEAVQSDDGAAVVTYQCADIGWIVRYVLQYGPEAEVIEPEVYRGAMRRAVVQNS